MENNPKKESAAAGGLLKSPFCSKLRTKNFYFLDRPAMDEDELFDASHDCWCNKTMHRVGPDGEMVDPEDCQKARGCFE